MKERLRSANSVLFGQMLLVGLFLGLSSRLQPALVPDTPLYTDFSWESPAAVLGNIRAPGYAAFLRAVAPGENRRFVPVAHYIAFCLAVLLFAAGLKQLGIGAWPRMWVASALLYANILHGYLMTVASDTLAAALAVASVGLLFLSLKNRRALVPFAVCVMAAYLVRPAYLSLVVQLPALGFAIVQSRRAQRPSAGELIRTAVVLASVTLIPLIAYCTLRSVIVGRFGVVASGGFNIIGIAGQFLDEEMAGSLPGDLRPLAQYALTHAPPEEGDPSVLMTDAPVLNYQRIENRYDRTIWDIFYPAAEQTESSAVTSVNTRLRRLAQEIIRQRPTMYAVYLAKALRRAVFKIVGDTVLNPYCLSLCLLITGVELFRILTPTQYGAAGGGDRSEAADARAAGARVRSEADGPAATGPGLPVGQTRPTGKGVEAAYATGQGSGPRYDLLSLMTLTALSYAAFQMAVVILVCPPLGRMTDAMSLFAPALLMAFLVDRTAPLVRR